MLGKAPASKPWTDFTINGLEKLQQAPPLACLPSAKLHKITICDPLSENPAHHAFYGNRDKTGNLYINV